MKKLTFAVAFAVALLATPAAQAGASVAVPEPSSLAMLIPGLFVLGGVTMGFRRKQ